MKMSGLCWTAVMLMLLLSAGNSFAAVDMNLLTNIANLIIDTYGKADIQQISVAANIPEKNAKIREIFKGAISDAAIQELKKKRVYTDSKVVVARPIFGTKDKPYTDHAEAVVLENIGSLVQGRAGNFLFFYSYYSPCWDKCTYREHKFNIIDKINEIIPNWNNHVLVFHEMYDKEKETTESLIELGGSKIGQDNIFACYKPQNKDFQCFKCFSNGKVVKDCVDENA